MASTVTLPWRTDRRDLIRAPGTPRADGSRPVDDMVIPSTGVRAFTRGAFDRTLKERRRDRPSKDSAFDIGTT